MDRKRKEERVWGVEAKEPEEEVRMEKARGGREKGNKARRRQEEEVTGGEERTKIEDLHVNNVNRH